MSLELAALRAGVAGLLQAGGHPALADLLRSAHLELVGAGERWSMGSREVTAQRVALAVPAAPFLELRGDAASLDAVRAAFAQAMTSPDTMLAEMYVELLLPGVERGWGSVYRDAPSRALHAEPSDPEAVLAGAAALLEAMGEPVAAAMMPRAQLCVASIPSAETPIRQCLVRLAPKDRARVMRDVRIEDRIRGAVRDAVLRAGEAVTVELGVRTEG